jgi:hypothetical protein
LRTPQRRNLLEFFPHYSLLVISVSDKSHRLSVAAIYQKSKIEMQNDSAKIKISERAQRESESAK